MNNFVERIEILLEEKKLKRIALANTIGIPNQSITDWKKRGTIPAGDIVLKIAQYLDVSFEWLITGEDRAAPKVSQDEKELIDTYRQADECSRHNALTILRDSASRSKQESSKNINA